MRTGEKLFIVTGEASGDLHGAELAKALWKYDRSLQIIGMGGKMMEKAGVEIIFDNRKLGVMGLVEVLTRWKSVVQSYRVVCEYLRKNSIDLLILIDFPDFNLRIARVAQEHRIPVVYYIGPKVWAWRSGRVKLIAERIDHMLVIFPFEEEIYQNANVSCKYVGHPLMDQIPENLERTTLRKRYGLDVEKPVVALLPGSRRQEIRKILPVMLSAADKITKRIKGVNFILPVAPSVDWESVEEQSKQWPISIKLVPEEAAGVLASADAAMVASGTATLEAALVGTPMVIVYRVAWLTYMLARLVVQVKYVGLVNILAGRSVVPELLQGSATGRRIADEIVPLLKEKEARNQMKDALAEVVQMLGPAGGSMRAAKEIMDRLRRKDVLDGHGSLQEITGVS